MAQIHEYKNKIVFYIKNPKNHPDIVAAGLIFSYILLMGKLVLDRYDALYVFAYDFGIFDQAIWSTAHGNLMWQTINTVRLGSHFGEHFEFLLVFLAPFNFIFSDGRFLLVIQTIFLALGALPLYLIAKLRFKSKWIPLVFPLTYLLYPYLHNVNLYDFHGILFAPLFIGLIWYSIEKDNIKLFTISVFISLLIKEDLFIIVVLLCIYAFFKTAHKRETAFLAIFCIIYGLSVINLVIPAFSGDSYRFANENTIQDIIANPPSNEIYIITEELFKPLMFLPLLDPIPFLTSSMLLVWHAKRDIALFLYFHYPAEIIPLIFISLILGLSNIPNYINYINKLLKNTKPKYKLEGRSFEILLSIICTLLIMSSTYYYINESQAANLHPLQYEQTKHDMIGIDLLKQIPPDSIVAAQSHLVPRLSHRKYIFMLPEIPEEFRAKIEYVIFDTNPDTEREFWPFQDFNEFDKSFTGYAENKDFRLVVKKDGYYIFKRK